MEEETPQKTYRIVGIGSDGTRTILDTGLSEWKALVRRARLVVETEFPKLVVECESAGKAK